MFKNTSRIAPQLISIELVRIAWRPFASSFIYGYVFQMTSEKIVCRRYIFTSLERHFIWSSESYFRISLKFMIFSLGFSKVTVNLRHYLKKLLMRHLKNKHLSKKKYIRKTQAPFIKYQKKKKKKKKRWN